MHELSIAHSLVEIADKAACEAGATQVTTVHLRLGVLSGVVKEALLFSFEIAAQGTRLAGATLAIEAVPLVVFCPQCQAEVTLPTVQRFRCPQCDTPTDTIIQGKELELVSIELVEDEPTTTAPANSAGDS